MNILNYIGSIITIAAFALGFILGYKLAGRRKKLDTHHGGLEHSMIPPEIKGPVDKLKGEKRALRVSRLITGYIMGTLTSSEHDELDEWVGASDENMKLFEELTGLALGKSKKNDG